MRDQKVEALKLVASWRCERSTTGWCGDDPSWTPYAEHLAERWCAPCIAMAAIHDKLPKRMICIEV